MKKLICLFLVLTLILCGCAPAGEAAEPTQPPTDPPTEPTEALEFTETEPPEDITLHITEPEKTAPQTIGATDKARIDYTGDVSAVYYVTSWEELPDYEALREAVGPEFFDDRALVVVLETVSSGSLELSIESIENGAVTLGRSMSGDAGTMDMATWLLWTEVDQGLDCQWYVTNSHVRSNLSTY